MYVLAAAFSGLPWNVTRSRPLQVHPLIGVLDHFPVHANFSRRNPTPRVCPRTHTAFEMTLSKVFIGRFADELGSFRMQLMAKRF